MKYNANAAFAIRSQLKASDLHVKASFDFSKEEIEQALKEAQDINCVDIKGFTPLHYAVTMQQTLAIKTLVDWGANLFAKDELGKTPLDIAKEQHYQTIITLLENYEEEQKKGK